MFCLQFECLSKTVARTFQCFLVGAVVRTRARGTRDVGFESSSCPTLRISCYYFDNSLQDSYARCLSGVPNGYFGKYLFDGG